MQLLDNPNVKQRRGVKTVNASLSAEQNLVPPLAQGLLFWKLLTEFLTN